MTSTYYPESPKATTRKLTSLTSSYRLRASLAVLAIILFFVLYFALVAGLAYLVYYSFTYDIGRVNKFSILMKIGAIAGAVMLFVFTLKFVFKLKNPKRTNRIRLVKKEQPELWAFVNRICKETGAPKPKAIYVDPDVNAYVSYSNMWLSLFLPVKKELTIGLGLVSCLNLSEFKAVMAHEFGHFAQSSMKIGSYIISANTIIHDMIFSRDKWDDLLDQWRGADIRLSFAAWIITPVIWIIRQILNLFYQFLNIMYSSLSREMEFNADKVAVSTTGSEAIVSALWKLDGGSQHWNSTMNHAYVASQKKMFVSNLYEHNNLAIGRTSETQKAQLEELPVDERGGRLFFTSSENSKVGMYASHPPNDQREHNAKIPFIDCEEDHRSPWLLFANKEELQEKMTQLIYKEYLNKTQESITSAEVFEKFIQDESKGSDLLSEFENTFENRYLHIPEKDVLLRKMTEYKDAGTDAITKLKKQLTQLMDPVREIEAIMLKAQQIANGTIKDKAFSFNGETYKKKDLHEGYNKLFAKREQIFNEDFKEWDTSFCALHLALAEKVGKKNELMKYYEQHNGIANVYKTLANVKTSIYNELAQLQSRSDVTEGEVRTFGHKVNDRVYSVNAEMDKLSSLDFVPLPNIETVSELKEAIIEGSEFKKYRGNMFEGEGFSTVMTQVENAIAHCQRIEQKSIGTILLFQKEMIEN